MLRAVLAMVFASHIDILCLQEAHLTENTISSAQEAARAAGWCLVCSSPTYDRVGRGHARVAVLSHWPVELVEQASGIDTARWVTLMAPPASTAPS